MTEDEQTIVQIPGTVEAMYRDGVIVELTFTPHASSAGYFGPAAVHDSGPDTILDDDGEEVDLDIESTDGPFWHAVQTFLADNEGKVTWTE